MWSRKHERCVSCGSNATKHYGHGLCKRCYQTSWVETNETHVQEYKHSWYVASKEYIDYKEVRSRNRNGTYATKIVKTGKCATCGTTEKLQVHHKDHKGQNVPIAARNNDPSNIEILCIVCHGRLHGKVDGWSRRYAACQSCNSIDRRHQALGLCTTCYSKQRYIPRAKV